MNSDQMCIRERYSTEEKTVRVLCAIQVAAQQPEKSRIFNMPSDAEVVL